jgi:hypothetical protein
MLGDRANGTVQLENPVDLRFSHLGLLVSDAGDLSVRALNAGNGVERWRVGRYGRGPWEFVAPPLLIGTWAEPVALEAAVGRIHEFRKLSARATSQMIRDRQWTTGCVLRPNALITQSSSSPVGMSYYVSQFGDEARVADSFPHPIERLQHVGFFVRQTPLAQVDDSSCAFIPAYHGEFALMDATGTFEHGFAVESLPPAEMSVEKTERGARYSVARGAVAGYLDARAWRDKLLILFEGRSRDKGKLLDVYNRRTLRYEGTILLPVRATRIAVSGDTIAILGVTQEDEPTIVIGLLKPKP